MTSAATEEWHARNAPDVMQALGAAEEGLSLDEVARRAVRHGPNRMPAPPRQHPVLAFLRQFNNALIYVLLACVAVTAMLGHWADSAVILAVVLINAIIGLVQEGKTEKAMNAIRDMLAPQATVLRDGRRMTVPGDTLVPGDIVLVEAGDRVPADLRVLMAHAVTVQEAILTGESAPVSKASARVAPAAALGERASMLYSGTIVTTGQGRGVVAATGAGTQIGRISSMLMRVTVPDTPLVRQMAGLSRWLTALVLLVAALMLAYGYFVGRYPFGEIFMAVVGLSVAAIPEGLPAVMTVTLAVGVQAMARRNAIVRRLPAIESIGAVSVICTDKTGTLTRNEMMVSSVVAAGQAFTLEGDGYAPSGTLWLDESRVDATRFAVLEELGRAAALCNDAGLHQRGGTWSVEGDPMEGALLAFAGKMGLDPGAERRAWPRTEAIAFDARHRYMATLHHDHLRHALVVVKGAPERVLDMCRFQRDATGAGAVTPLERGDWERQAEAIACRGQRVLAFAALPLPDSRMVLEESDVETGLTLLGMVGMIDPPRAEAREAIAQCHEAGIAVKMITGDHARTAAAIAAQVGLHNPQRVLGGADLDAMDDATLRAAVAAAMCSRAPARSTSCAWSWPCRRKA